MYYIFEAKIWHSCKVSPIARLQQGIFSSTSSKCTFFRKILEGNNKVYFLVLVVNVPFSEKF